ncbi:Membrane-anchored ribosome-binding protein, inhibits growth in stationary phase, ElaB/YqjD/DUF883 family [Pseudomonas citronellolis]|jgi:ElaB/YqjD/DUF883 family membrane-anchored ribosome-binding protein|uniref:Membrane-anchored ribosome-binding protein, inhibits growth in stationary phase, ElaB/YqjD/DUF883 family n=1 Tax=Pseudomonas citronellolis TaxID=53408 RepID=A0A127MPX4_9PSED|nr:MULTISPECIES: YqjD family protein [Pseudomonas]KSW23102.1 hypothetical protein AOX63_06780 [Pseudomonas sp. ADP]AMO75342.1 hypothetical protein PcP3B5_18870 [Pseudomonas citronellolis]ANI14166.1 hypothetical protein A9C11_09320 [Pseudomonas citronellolis]KES25519.1 membrane protein [Pseudomonas sp. AAC]KRV81899.1 hypothetical protein AO742_01115 [Pseudomonas citronellolis]
MPRKSTANTTKDELLAEFQALVADTEKLLQTSAELAGEEADALREQLRSGLGRARERIDAAQSAVRDQGRAAVDATEDYVGEHPWQAVGVAAGVGFLLGLLVGRR